MQQIETGCKRPNKAKLLPRSPRRNDGFTLPMSLSGRVTARTYINDPTIVTKGNVYKSVLGRQRATVFSLK